MAEIHITIPGNPIPQSRPRFSNGHAYDTDKCRAYKNYVRLIATSQMRGKKMLDGPLWLSLKIHREIPKSWPVKQRQAAQEGRKRPTSTPDLDNMIKSVTDAIIGVCYKDDSLIVEYRDCGKWYSLEPRVEITIGGVE